MSDEKEEKGIEPVPKDAAAFVAGVGTGVSGMGMPQPNSPRLNAKVEIQGVGTTLEEMFTLRDEAYKASGRIEKRLDPASRAAHFLRGQTIPPVVDVERDQKNRERGEYLATHKDDLIYGEEDDD